MSESKPEIPPVFRGLNTPEPPAELHDRTMRAAVDALTRPVVPDIWTRLWQSRALRVAWAGCVALLAIGHIAVAPRRTGSGTVAAVPTVRHTIETNDELTAIARLPRLELSAQGLSLLGEGDRTNGRGTDTVAPTPHHRKENAS